MAVQAETDVRVWLHDDFGVDARTLDAVRPGADRAACTWRAATDDGALAVRWTAGGSPGGLEATAAITRTLPPAPPLAPPPPALVASPRRTRTGALWAERSGGRLTVSTWLDGPRALDVALTPPQWTAFGRLLARAHAVRPEAAPHLPRTDFRPGRALVAFDAADEGTASAVVDELAAEAGVLWQAARHRLLEVRTRSIRLGARLQQLQREDPRSVPLVVCHGDPHLGNVLVTGPRDVALVDWDDAVLAPPEHDLMFLLGGVLAYAPVTPEQAAAFFTGYGRVEIDPDRLAYAQCVRAMDDVADLALGALDARRTDAERASSLDLLAGALSRTGIVDLALG